jgi:hypothetical protein
MQPNSDEHNSSDLRRYGRAFVMFFSELLRST